MLSITAFTRPSIVVFSPLQPSLRVQREPACRNFCDNGRASENIVKSARLSSRRPDMPT
jgi:hypothetical protein